MNEKISELHKIFTTKETALDEYKLNVSNKFD